MMTPGETMMTPGETMMTPGETMMISISRLKTLVALLTMSVGRAAPRRLAGRGHRPLRHLAAAIFIASLSWGQVAIGDDTKWEGWASTTQFGAGDPTWGEGPNTIALEKINNSAANRMGAAVPWRFYCNWYGSKSNEVETVADSIQGKNDLPACFLVQPITKFADEISGNTDGAPSFCAGDSCLDLQSSELSAKDSAGNPFPTYLLVPFEGCGGDCKPEYGADCMNSCATGTDFANATKCQFSLTTSEACGAMRALEAGGTWAWNDDVEKSFLQYSMPIAISAATDYGKDVGKVGEAMHVNWCSGQNMHFDIAMTDPLWVGLSRSAQDPPVSTTGDLSNIMVRYRRVRCNINGMFDAKATSNIYYVKCPGDSWDTGGLNCSKCSGTCLKPGDKAWPDSTTAKHYCCRQ